MLNIKDMIMLRLTQTEDFKTIISLCSTKGQIQNASDNFILKIIALCDAERDLVSLFRTLRLYTLLPTTLAKGRFNGRRGKKCIRTALCH